MKHSCGHAAPKDLPRDAVRRTPRCTLCERRDELQNALQVKTEQLALMYPYTSLDSLKAAVEYGTSGNLAHMLERATTFVDNYLEWSELVPWLSEHEIDEMVRHAETGD